MSSPLVRNQHYVPQFYLKNFSANQKGLYGYDKKSKRAFPAGIEDIANESYFYDLTPSQEAKLGTGQFIERFFCPLEGVTAKTIRDILQRAPKSKFLIEECEIKQLSKFLFYQFVRTREFRAFLLQSVRKTIKCLGKLHLKMKFGVDDPDFTVETDDSLAHAKFILNDKRRDECMATFQGYLWILVENRTRIPFFSSDNPFVKIGHKESPVFTYAGLKSEGIEIAFPISSKYLLVLLEQNYFKKYSPSHRNKIILDKEPQVNFYNWLQIKGAHRQIYCETKAFSPVVDEAYKLTPELFDIDRPRVIVDLLPVTKNRNVMHVKLVDISISSSRVIGSSRFL